MERCDIHGPKWQQYAVIILCAFVPIVSVLMIRSASKELLSLALSIPFAIVAVIFAGYMIGYTIKVLRQKIPIYSLTANGITCHRPIVIVMPWSDIKHMKCQRFLFSKCIGIYFNDPHLFLKRQGLLIRLLGESNAIFGCPPFVIFQYHLPDDFEILKEKIHDYAPQLLIVTT
jgi:hypothetical protein